MNNRRTKVHKVEVLVLDLNGPSCVVVGDRMPRVEFSTVMNIETREVEWTDEHPLNQHKTQHAAYQQLFEDAEVELIARRILTAEAQDGNTFEYGEDATKLARHVLGLK